ncbi:MAG: polyprenyl synthetase family protein [Planctomycetaceae bacterium]|nr:polyprenyl synthetase family protein [Planctomycetaceae bacterium]
MNDPQLVAWIKAIEDRLKAALDRGPDCPDRLRDAMAYSLLGGGKRLRPLLVLIACEACGGDVDAALPAACAIEMVHTYSLIHDDLPAMDDDDQRRGRPTCHRQFDEGTAILAGDALLTLAFELLATDISPAATAAACCAELARAAGMCGMVGGQMADLEQAAESSTRQVAIGQGRAASDLETHARGPEIEGGPLERSSEALQQSFSHSSPPPTLALLESLHRRKTGRLLTAALLLGGRVAGADRQTLGNLATYGESIGLAFQIVDDLLDVRGDSATMGKQVRKDQAAGKLTYPGILGEAESRRRAEQLIDVACQAVAEFGTRGQRLEAMAHFVIARDR